ncbi:hypothetical protein CQS04_09835 [Chryseomicrobium excrementi]|uniref:Sigma factor regulator C-terminal domain-containing protein n=1 Tax=Chryseomicrobium excrementi TaxID=2041346 RepID=A0A2M9EYB2_9BACL|nr:anti-sigma factor [Chryseomicrobium excrementi]PJK16201.1 hypothetical protein CQS04_09835 [Chryseomicrobium excrementi]
MNTKWNKDVEKRILRKSRFTLTFRIVRILIVAVFLYAVYVSALDVYANTSKSLKKAHFYNELAIEWMHPNVRSDMPQADWQVDLLWSGKAAFPLYKKVGLHTVPVGEAEVTKPVWPLLGSQSVELEGNRDYAEIEFQFYYPEHPMTQEPLGHEEFPETWETLERLPEGTVAELAFSLDSFMTAEELLDKLADYDLHVTWMALHAGENEKGSGIQQTSYGLTAAEEETLVGEPIGLVPAYTMEKDYMGSTLFYALEKNSLEDSQKAMLDNMSMILKESKDYQESFLGLQDLQYRYNYIKENGFIVYGAVVTGPSKELLKLQDEEGIESAQLGEVELWKWENK